MFHLVYYNARSINLHCNIYGQTSKITRLNKSLIFNSRMKDSQKSARFRRAHNSILIICLYIDKGVKFI